MTKYPTREEITQRLDSLPEDIKNVFLSPDSVDIVSDVTARQHLDLDKENVIFFLVGCVLLGFLHPEDLVREISERTKIDKRIAKEIADEISIKILAPIASSLNQTHGFHLAVPPAAQAISRPPARPDESPVPTVPQLKETPRETNPAAEEPATKPLVLHEHAPSETPSPKDGEYEGGLLRPSFYTPPGGDAQSTDTPRAHLEIGTPDIQGEPQTARVGKEQARIVHYAAPDAPADPFANRPVPPPQAKPVINKTDIPQNNVVDLKNLPQ